MTSLLRTITRLWRLADHVIESRIQSATTQLLPQLCPLPQLSSTDHTYTTTPYSPGISIRDQHMLNSRPKKGNGFSSHEVNEELTGFFQRSNRDIIAEKTLDFYAVCPAWMQRKTPKDLHPFPDKKYKGVITKLMIMNPGKPNSGNRKCCEVQINIMGRVKMVRARIPGERNTLQEHHRVYVRPCKMRDVPTVKWAVIRGQLDAQY